MRSLATLVAAVGAILVFSTSPAEAVGGEGQTWPAFTESSACGAQRIPTAHADETGWLAHGDLLRGDFGAFFGRTVQDVHNYLVRYNVPGSPFTVGVHPWMVPALEDAHEAILELAETEGRYQIRPDWTGSAASRTIGGSLRISRHTYGIAIDINAPRNPYRGDNKLITDFPDWWVQSFLDAGFCWGGLWVGSKDTMHWAWQGPAFSDYDSIPLPYEPVTDLAPFELPERILTVDSPATVPLETILADTTENGTVDVVRIRPNGTDVVIDSSISARNHDACSARRSHVPGLGARVRDAAAFGFGDWDGLGGNDFWVLNEQADGLGLTVRWAFGGYNAEWTSTLDIPVPADSAWVSTADFDVDGNLDLAILDEGVLTIWDVDPETGEVAQQGTFEVPTPDGAMFSWGDRDLDNRPDLWTLDGDDLTIRFAASDWQEVDYSERIRGVPDSVLDISASEYDGDGRPDLILFDGHRKLVWLGNTPMPDGHDPEVWFLYDELECDRPSHSASPDELRFTAGGWTAEGSYEWRRAQGYAVGCDPERDDCEPPISTHRMLVEFFAWIDELEPVGDDPDMAAARAVLASGHPLPCPLSDTACWDAPVDAQDLSALFGKFLSDRRATGIEPHRWIVPRTYTDPGVMRPE